MKRIFSALFLISSFTFFSVLACPLSDLGICRIVESYATYLGSGAIQLGIFSAAMFFLWKKDLRSTLEPLGFPGNLKTDIAYTILCLASIFLILLVIGAVSIIGGFNDQQNVSDKIAGLPLAILALAALFAPVSEELFFRGLLSPRFGAVLSSLVFGIVHFTYGSAVEMLGAFFIGIVLALTFRKSKSITPCILAHMIYNIIAIFIMRTYT